MVGDQIGQNDPYKISLFLFVYSMSVFILLIVFLVLPLKAILGRERPSRIMSVFRYLNMRDLEQGKAMPSGDSACCAYFCSLYAIVFGYWIALMIIPFVCIGRVYVHCHWIGDTMVGATLGMTIAYVFYGIYFTEFS